MSNSGAQAQADKWNSRFADTSAAGAASAVLAENTHLLPAKGRALDLACGTGGNGLLLATHGLTTVLWDISAVALEKQQTWGSEQGLVLETQERDCENDPPPPGSFDVISVAHFLHRPLFPALQAALRPGGVLFYQTFTANKLDPGGPGSPDFLLQPGELLALLPGLAPRFYREEDRCGDLARGDRNRAMLVAQKPLD